MNNTFNQKLTCLHSVRFFIPEITDVLSLPLFFIIPHSPPQNHLFDRQIRNWKSLESELSRVKEFRQSLVWQKNFLLLLLIAQSQAPILAAAAAAKSNQSSRGPIEEATNLSAYFANFPKMKQKSALVRFRSAYFAEDDTGLWLANLSAV